MLKNHVFEDSTHSKQVGGGMEKRGGDLKYVSENIVIQLLNMDDFVALTPITNNSRQKYKNVSAGHFCFLDIT